MIDPKRTPMKQLYTILFLSFIFLGMQAQAGSSPVQESPAPAVDPIVDAAPGAEVLADVADKAGKMAAGPVAKSGAPAWQEKATTVSITSITMPEPLNITHFGNYEVDVALKVPADYTVHTVTLSTTPVTLKSDAFETDFDWDYYTYNTATSTAENDPVVKTKTEAESNGNYLFERIRPDDIYPEIHFASSDITHNNVPEDILVNQDNQQLMHFNNPFNMVANTSFFIEFYAEPASQRPPPPVGLDVYLVPAGVASSAFESSDWITDTNAKLVATIGRGDDFDHEHSAYSMHHVVYLSADNEGLVQGLDVSGDFWVVLSAHTSDERRSWNLKYHKDDGNGTACSNHDTWFIRKGDNDVVSQAGCPDSHVHLARNADGVQVDGVKHVVTVDYSDNGTSHVAESYKYFYFGDIPNLPPNASSFIGPPAGIYSGTITIEWNPATDPNNHNVAYDIYLYDVGTQSDVYTVTTTYSGNSFSFDTKQGDPPPPDGVYNIRMVASDADKKGEDGETLYSSPFFLYDIYAVREEFVIANDPYTWTGGTDSDWNKADNWDQSSAPGSDDLAFVPADLATNPMIKKDVAASAKRLSIAKGEIVTIQNGGSLTVGQSLVNDAGINGLVVEAGGSLIHNTPWPSEGIKATLKRPITGGGTWAKADVDGWHLLSSPVGTQTITTFTTDGVSGDNYDFYGWSESEDLWKNQKTGQAFIDWNNGEHFMIGRGYLVAYEQTQNLEFTGSLNVADVTKTALTKSGTGDASGGEHWEAGWHLLGNPFASGLVWGDGSWAGENIGYTAKIWSDGAYIDIQNGTTAIIPAHQGFFVQVEEETARKTGTVSGTITIPAKARTHEGTWYKQNQVPHIVLTASATESGLRQRNVVREAPAGGGNFNAVFLAGNAPQFYAIPDEVPLSTIALEEITDDTVIPYTFIKNHEGSEFQIAVEKAMEDQDIYLIDLVEDAEHQLTVEEPYVFSSSADDPPERFELRFTPSDTPTSVDPPEEMPDDTRIYVLDNILHLEFTDVVGSAQLQLIDTEGRLAMADSLDNGTHFTIPLNVTPGIYIVRIIRGENLITKKVAVTQ